MFKGKVRAHTLDINDICFGYSKNDQRPNLYSIGKDMFLVEYEILDDENSLEKELVVKNCDKIESN